MPMVAIITVTMDEKGQVLVESNAMANKLLCYALLEAARDVVCSQGGQQQRLITAPPAGSVEFLASQKKG